MSKFGEKLQEAIAKRIEIPEIFLKNPFTIKTVLSIEKYLLKFEEMEWDKEYIHNRIYESLEGNP